MSVIDARPKPKKFPETTPPDVDERVRRGKQARDKDKLKRRLFRKFWAGEQYWFMTARGGLSFQTSGMTGVVSNDKTSYRIRNTYNYVQAIIEAKVSAATQRVPGYEVTPSTDDPEDEAAASLAGQVATYGYDKWRVRRATTKAVTNALVAREGFVMPYFDPNVGPFETDPQTGETQGKGEVRLLTLSRDEVMWEDGEDFDDSRWHAIERAMLIADVKKIPGFVGIPLEPDAPDGKVNITEFLERPCSDYPQGRRIFLAGGRPIVDYRGDPNCEPGWEDWWEPFPCMDATGVVCDEPCLHRISYVVNPDGDDLGLVERIIDLQRTINDCMNKLLEWKNRALLPQMIAPRGSNVARRDDTPGATWFYDPNPYGKPEWEQPPRVPQELFQMYELAVTELRALSADVDVQADPRLTSGGANAAIQQAQSRWQSFLGDLAEFHSRLMRHCLSLVARYYDEQRQIDIRGQYGWQPMAAFAGQDLRSQVNVRVLPGSLESKSRQAIQQEIQFIQANWPGAISPEAALATMHGGSAEGLIRSYQNDVAKAWRIVRRLRTGPEAMNSFGTRFDPNVPNLTPDPATGLPAVDPLTGGPIMGADVPNWMPGPWDSVPIWRQVIGDYMKTEDFEHLDEPTRHNFELIWQGLDESERMRAAKQAAQQQMQAQSLGMGNAAKPGVPPPLPDRAGFTPENSSPVPAA